jgi:hypothetical protein
MLRSFTSVYQLLPSYRCLDVGGEWKLLDEVDAIPNVDPKRLAEALKLHRSLRQAVEDAGEPLLRYDIRPIVGDTQRTKWGARLTSSGVEVRYDRGQGQDGGDGTVPRVSAVPPELLDGWRNVAFFSEKHGSLQNDEAVFEHLSGVLRIIPLETRDVFPAGDTPVALDVDDVTTAEPLEIRALPRDPLPRWRPGWSRWRTDPRRRFAWWRGRMAGSARRWPGSRRGTTGCMWAVRGCAR